ncbi:MAG: hypothetical protein FJ151_03060, partial [Euryarchaeota archaeon]|nr:hypothetical protein [Euryarchaeota archaeon]
MPNPNGCRCYNPSEGTPGTARWGGREERCIVFLHVDSVTPLRGLRMKWKADDYWVSHYNFMKEIKFPKSIRFHDTTFRDGEQQPGVVFRSDEKLRIGTMMSEIGMDRIEGGMPLVSADDKKAVKMLASAGLEAEVFAFTRCMKDDVETSVDCGVDGVIMEVPSSGQLIEDAYEWSEEKAKKLAVEATAYA